jgi:flagellin-like protein
MERRAQKGISPLIAAVILIALTMAIAGIMAAFATQITTSQIDKSQEKANCLGALDLSSSDFTDTNISVKVTNQAERENLTGFIADIEYSDPAKSKQHSNIQMKNFNFRDPLPANTADWFIYNTQDTTVPRSVFIFASNCGRDFGTRLVVR